MLRHTSHLLRNAYYSSRFQGGLDQFLLPTRQMYHYRNQVSFDPTSLRASYFVKTPDPYVSNFYIVTPRVKGPAVDPMFLL